MRQLSREDLLRASADPTFGRRLLDTIETGVRPARRGGRRIVARMVPPGTQTYERWLGLNGYAGMDRQMEAAFGKE